MTTSGQLITGLAQPPGPELDPAVRAEAEAGLGAFLLPTSVRLVHDDGTIEDREPRGFSIGWTCCRKPLGSTYLVTLPDGTYGVGTWHRGTGRVVVEGEGIRLDCPARGCRRRPLVPADRMLAWLLDLARAYPETRVRRVVRDLHYIG